MGLEREDIVRDDFPTVRRGWDPDAVRAHLRDVAAAVSERDRSSATPLAAAAAERVGSIVAAAEEKAGEIEAEARSEAERIISAARAEARQQVDRAQGAVSKLVDQADDLRSAVGRLGSQISSQVSPGAGSDAADEPAGRAARDDAAAETAPEVVPEPPRVPEPMPPQEPEPQPPQTPEPTPPPSPEPGPPTIPEPQPPSPQIRAGRPSTDDLIAQLRGTDTPGRDANGGGSASGQTTDAKRAGSAGEADVAAARLVAMKMALDGASRDEIALRLEEDYSIPSTDELLDDVLDRAKP